MPPEGPTVWILRGRWSSGGWGFAPVTERDRGTWTSKVPTLLDLLPEWAIVLGALEVQVELGELLITGSQSRL